jgi:inosose dehydratase
VTQTKRPPANPARFNFQPILQALADADYEGWLMVEAEQDPAKANPLDYARKARAYLRDIAGL